MDTPVQLHQLSSRLHVCNWGYIEKTTGMAKPDCGHKSTSGLFIAADDVKEGKKWWGWEMG